MSKNRVIYQTQALLVGPSSSTGFHFLNYTGLLNDEYYNLGSNHNLLQSINRIQNVSFSLDAPREEVRQLGSRGAVSRPIINPPGINLEFEYLLNGLANDARIGLNVNYAQFQYPYSGTPFYESNYQVNLLSGLMARQFGQPTGDPYWPMPIRDNRNIFLITADEYSDVNYLGLNHLTVPDVTRGVGLRATGHKVMAFGHCFLNSYETRGAVHSIPKSRVSYSCENIAFYMSGSGVYTPAINTQTRKPLNQKHFNIPDIRDEGGPSVLMPGDITVDIIPSGIAGLTGLGLSFNDIKIQEYGINIDFKRDLLTSIGYQMPLDREITFPLYARLNFGCLVGDSESGNFIDILNQDSGYNVALKLKNKPFCSRFPVIYNNTTHPKHAGPAVNHGDVAIRYDFWNAKFDSISYENTISSNKYANLNFSVELNPDNLSNGLFISGLLNINKIEDYLLTETGDYIVDENNDLVVLNLIPLY